MSDPIIQDHSPLPPLKVENLEVSYGSNSEKELSAINFTLKRGEILGVVGANGAGKSTLVKAILELIPYQGRASFFGQSFQDVKQEIAYIPQKRDIDWDFPVTALDVCLMGMQNKIGFLKPIRKKNRIEAIDYLEKVGLSDFSDKSIGDLSGGQQQRVFIARALAQNAKILILDEPFAAVDQKSQELLFKLLIELKKDGLSFLIIHHNLQAVKEYFDRIILLNKTIIAMGVPDDVLTIENMNKAYGGWVI